MYEFDSVSVSSFEAAELAATLTAKSTEGWDVVAIVPAGSDVVAYLRRSTDEGAEQTTTDDTATDSSATDSVATVSAPDPTSSAAELLAADTTTSPNESAADSTTATTSDASATGWAANGTTSGSGWGTSDTTGSWGGSSQQSPVAAAPAQATPSVPAGWYADPAGRFELRYWDGGAWTEHVSRAGQQYTDPPVA